MHFHCNIIFKSVNVVRMTLFYNPCLLKPYDSFEEHTKTDAIILKKSQKRGHLHRMTSQILGCHMTDHEMTKM